MLTDGMVLQHSTLFDSLDSKKIPQIIAGLSYYCRCKRLTAQTKMMTGRGGLQNTFLDFILLLTSLPNLTLPMSATRAQG